MRGDPLLRVTAYRLALRAGEAAWPDVHLLLRHRATALLAGQLYRAVGSVAANIAEGYSRSSGRDRARLFEYALGSTRESIVWYRLGRPVIGTEVTEQRMIALAEIRRLLLAMIPTARRQMPVRPGQRQG